MTLSKYPPEINLTYNFGPHHIFEMRELQFWCTEWLCMIDYPEWGIFGVTWPLNFDK